MLLEEGGGLNSSLWAENEKHLINSKTFYKPDASAVVMELSGSPWKTQYNMIMIY